MKKIKKLFKNEAAKRILLFFNENPNCIDTAKGISLWIGYDVALTQKALNHLVKENILINHRTISTSAYAYTNNKAIVKKIEKYIKNIR
jgi:hypothetical protein